MLRAEWRAGYVVCSNGAHQRLPGPREEYAKGRVAAVEARHDMVLITRLLNLPGL